MKYWLLITIIFLAFHFSSCDNPSSPDDTFQATVYLQYPTDTPYNIFQVIESESFDKPEINIHYGDYLNDHPDHRSIIESDTIDVQLEHYISEYGSDRYRLLQIY